MLLQERSGCHLSWCRIYDSNGKIAKDTYQKAVDVPGKRKSTLMQLAWSVTGFEMLNKQANEFITSFSVMQSQLLNGEQGNVQKSLLLLKPKLFKYLHGLYTKKRIPATHFISFHGVRRIEKHKTICCPCSFYALWLNN